MSNLANTIDVLQKLKPELVKNYHVSSIGLFGSVVRNDFTANSDIDIIVDFSRSVGMEFIDLANVLEHALKHRVDVVSKIGLQEKYYKAIEHDIVYV